MTNWSIMIVVPFVLRGLVSAAVAAADTRVVARVSF
jgi:hypothetical protein